MRSKEFDRKKIFSRIQDFLSKEELMVFAYLHGTFISEDEFNDIDIALYIDDKVIKKIAPTEFEISWSLRLEKYLNLPVDVKILNGAPLSFRYHATQGILLFCRNEIIREEFLCRTWSEYLDFRPVSRIYLEETFHAPV